MALKAAVRDALRELEDTEGRLTPDLVVEAARDPAHPLHEEFDWDNSIISYLFLLIMIQYSHLCEGRIIILNILYH